METIKENLLRKRNSELQENLEKLQSELATLKHQIHADNYDKLFSYIKNELSNINEQIRRQCEAYEALIRDLTNYKNDIRKIFLDDSFNRQTSEEPAAGSFSGIPHGNK